MPGVAKKTVVDLFYDIVSPYSYIAFSALSRFDKKSHIDLQLHPALLTGVFKQSRNVAPTIVPAKFEYIMMDTARMARYYNIPFKHPVVSLPIMHKRGSLSAMRLLTAIKEHCPQYLKPTTDELFRGLWSKDFDLTELENLQQSCRNVGISDEDVNGLFTLVQNQDVKQKLKDSTQSASDYGAFGLPFFIAHLAQGSEIYFGCDRLPLLAHHLNVSESDYFSQ